MLFIQLLTVLQVYLPRLINNVPRIELFIICAVRTNDYKDELHFSKSTHREEIRS